MDSGSIKVKVILNGDDFGYSKGINRGIIKTIENGILTSTSVMVNRPEADEVRLLSKFRNISIGLHLDLTEENLLLRWFKILYILIWPRKKIEEEFKKQIDKFRSLTGKLPDHIDSHHHIHWITGFKPVVLEFARKNKIPVRCKNAKFNVSFYGRSWWDDSEHVNPERMIDVLKGLKPGVHEIMCHPGYVDKELINTGTHYLKQRENEIESLTSREIIDFIEKNKYISLVSWNEIVE